MAIEAISLWQPFCLADGDRRGCRSCADAQRAVQRCKGVSRHRHMPKCIRALAHVAPARMLEPTCKRHNEVIDCQRGATDAHRFIDSPEVGFHQSGVIFQTDSASQVVSRSIINKTSINCMAVTMIVT